MGSTQARQGKGRQRDHQAAAATKGVVHLRTGDEGKKRNKDKLKASTGAQDAYRGRQFRNSRSEKSNPKKEKEKTQEKG